MSVTLKLSDKDAGVVGDLLSAIAIADVVPNSDQEAEAVAAKEMVLKLRTVISHWHTTQGEIRTVAGAFLTAFRANQR